MSITRVEIECEVIECGHEKCHIPMILERGFVMRRRNDHRDFFCPNGHPNMFPLLELPKEIIKKIKKENKK